MVAPAAVPPAAAPAAVAALDRRAALARGLLLLRDDAAVFLRDPPAARALLFRDPLVLRAAAALLLLRLPAARLRDPLLLLLRDPLLFRDPLDRALLFRLFRAPPRFRDPPRPPREPSAASDRCSSPTRALISPARSLLATRWRSDSSICPCCRARLLPGLTPLSGIRLLSRAGALAPAAPKQYQRHGVLRAGA
jgi:hypothetical protein